MRRRPKKVRADETGGPSIDQLCRFHPEEWLTDDEAAQLTSADNDPLEHVAWRRWSIARDRWRAQQGLSRGEGYARLQTECRRLSPPIHDAVGTTQERSELPAVGGHDS